MIPEHQRRNSDRTDQLLHETRVLLTALELADDAAPERTNLDRHAQAVPALICMLSDKLDEIDKARAWEWSGLGGVSELLGEAEVHEAAGPMAEAVLQKRAENDQRRQQLIASRSGA